MLFGEDGLKFWIPDNNLKMNREDNLNGVNEL